MATRLLLLVQLLALLALVASASVPSLDASSSWSLLAWGFNSGGHDVVDGARVVVVDAFDADAANVAQLRAAGHTVMCYFSAGTLERWRDDYNASTRAAWDDVALVRMADWDDEWWLDVVRADALQPLVDARLAAFARKGCDAIEADNVDCYANRRCAAALAERDAAYTKSVVRDANVAYARWLAGRAHALGMAVALKNALELVPRVVDVFDAAMNEQCYEFNECDALQPFVDAHKLVMNVEYRAQAPTWCDTRALASSLRTKWCDGRAGAGVCKRTAAWINCFAPQALLPRNASAARVAATLLVRDRTTRAALAGVAVACERRRPRPVHAFAPLVTDDDGIATLVFDDGDGDGDGDASTLRVRCTFARDGFATRTRRLDADDAERARVVVRLRPLAVEAQ